MGSIVGSSDNRVNVVTKFAIDEPVDLLQKLILKRYWFHDYLTV